ncbi:MAG: isochorismatase family protein [Candidatus Sphingomonas phytovorans]|nr:isochorismatase family protein [Sphingomonas sp.]WEK02253.1 MAG: isochorismatase family protein [Sphingomonas sp.]
MADLSFDPAQAALVVIDLQHGVATLPTTPHSGPDVVSRTAQLADALRIKGGTIVWVNVMAPAGPLALTPELDNPPKFPAAFPAQWSELVPELGVQAEDVRVFKRNWGAFYGTDLDLHLRRRGIRTIILTGIATNMGVESTARDAFERGYDQIFVEDAMSGLGENAHATALGSTFQRMGRVRSTADVLASLGA